MHFTKVHGLGNDFVMVDAESEELPGNLSKLAQAVCDRHFGIGADGLVLIWPTDEADIRMQILNSDGSEAEMCGNAIRCVSKYIYEKGIIKKEQIKVETKAGIMVPEVSVQNGVVAAVKVDMGEPKLDRKEIPMLGSAGMVIGENLKVGEHNFKVTAVSMGNPHVVIFVVDVDEVPISHWGPRIENHNIFPNKTNVEFVQVLNRSEVRMQVWERGAGPTMACGTGACATAVAAHLNGFTEKQVSVHLASGSLDIEWSENNHVYMTGPAEEIFSGDYPLQNFE
ncbi:MAG: diaminopimelate epimerase [Firmicutes bacterium]|nr:diaminopimelate epimerase [Bacillota bacterium]